MTSIYHSFLLPIVIIFCFDNLHHAAALEGKQAQPVGANELPFVVSLAYDNNRKSPRNNHFCTGTLISDQYVLTAKHCTELLTDYPSIIYIGSTSLRACRRYHWDLWTSYGTWATIHKRPTDPINDDVAVVKLKEKVEDVKSAMLYSTPNGVAPGKTLYVAGWGELDNGIRPDHLQKASVVVLPTEECDAITKNYVPPKFLNWDRKICTKSNPRLDFAILACGDSGGPLYDEEYRIVGINKGICPVPMRPPKDRVNLHPTVMFYRDFLSQFYY